MLVQFVFQLFFLESCTWYLKDFIQSYLKNSKGSTGKTNKKTYFFVHGYYENLHASVFLNKMKNKQTNEEKHKLPYTFELLLSYIY